MSTVVSAYYAELGESILTMHVIHFYSGLAFHGLWMYALWSIWYFGVSVLPIVLSEPQRRVKTSSHVHLHHDNWEKASTLPLQPWDATVHLP